MKNIYNKGRYRFHEYGHLRPYLKRQGNKRWRKTTSGLLDELDYEVTGVPIAKIPRKPVKERGRIHVKITESLRNGTVLKYYKRYRTVSALENAVKRNAVLSVYIIAPENMETTPIIESKLNVDWTKVI